MLPLIVTLTFGRKKPEDGDKGAPVFEALENNIDLDDSHNHDGTDSAKLDKFNLNAGTVSVPTTGWTASGNLFRQSVTFPAGYSVANGSEWGKINIAVFKEAAGVAGEKVCPKIEKIDDTSFYLYSPVNNQGFRCIFG